MSKYDKELDTRTGEYEKAIEPLKDESQPPEAPQSSPRRETDHVVGDEGGAGEPPR
jgi:hypothetical protein